MLSQEYHSRFLLVNILDTGLNGKVFFSLDIQTPTIFYFSNNINSFLGRGQSRAGQFGPLIDNIGTQIDISNNPPSNAPVPNIGQGAINTFHFDTGNFGNNNNGNPGSNGNNNNGRPGSNGNHMGSNGNNNFDPGNVGVNVNNYG